MWDASIGFHWYKTAGMRECNAESCPEEKAAESNEQ